MPRVAVMMGSDSDWPVMRPAAEELGKFAVDCDVEVTSAHRTPERTVKYVRDCVASGVKVFIVGAGGAAHLAGTVAAHTTLPVIAVPVANSLQGLDALLASVQMPPGIPVATVAIDGARNAALLAVQILGTSDARLAAALIEHREEQGRVVAAKSAKLRAELGKSRVG